MSRLGGKRIVVTRAEQQAADLCELLEAEGAIPIRCPSIRIAAPESYETLDSALRMLHEYRWVVFTSTNAVRAVLDRMRRIDVPDGALAATSVAAVGPRTRHVLDARGITVAYVPEEHRGAALSEQLDIVSGARVLLPRSEIASRDTIDDLRGRGAEVDAVVAYRTVHAPHHPDVVAELRDGFDAITFTSPSTVEGFIHSRPEWRVLLRGAMVVTLGPVTSAAATSAGLLVHFEARDRTMEGLTEALVVAFTQRFPGAEETARA